MKKFILVLAFILSCIIANAQINIGVGAYIGGNEKLTISKPDNKETIDLYKNTYTPTYGAELFYEVNVDNLSVMFDLSYATGKISSIEKNAQYSYAPYENKTFPDFKSYSLASYMGHTFFPNKRFQIPVYLGLGYDRITSGPSNRYMFFWGAKARLKLYITDTIGLYIGGNWKSGSVVAKDDYIGKIAYASKRAEIEIGLTFML